MDTNFEHPRVKTLAGSELSIQGVVRDMQFRLKGSNKTFCRDFFVSDALDDWYDFVLGKDFMKKNFDMLFGPGGKVQKMIGGLFGTKRRTPAEKAQEAALKAQQEADAKNREADRLARKANEKRQAEETQRIEEANFQNHYARNTN